MGPLRKSIVIIITREVIGIGRWVTETICFDVYVCVCFERTYWFVEDDWHRDFGQVFPYIAFHQVP